MTHDVFISYPSQNKPLADAICAKLEAEQIRCWIAPRDILPGQNYAEALLKAIDSCRVFILVFSDSTNKSPHIMSEVQRAFNNNRVIIPFRIEDISPSTALEYYIGNAHWLDALTPPADHQIDTLARVVQANLNQETEISPLPPRPARIEPPAPGITGSPYFYPAIILILLVICAALAVGIFSPHPPVTAGPAAVPGTLLPPPASEVPSMSPTAETATPYPRSTLPSGDNAAPVITMPITPDPRIQPGPTLTTEPEIPAIPTPGPAITEQTGTLEPGLTTSPTEPEEPVTTPTIPPGESSLPTPEPVSSQEGDETPEPVMTNQTGEPEPIQADIPSPEEYYLIMHGVSDVPPVRTGEDWVIPVSSFGVKSTTPVIWAQLDHMREGDVITTAWYDEDGVLWGEGENVWDRASATGWWWTTPPFTHQPTDSGKIFSVISSINDQEVWTDEYSPIPVT